MCQNEHKSRHRDQDSPALALHGQGGRQGQGAESLQGLVPPHPLHGQGLPLPQKCGPVQRCFEVKLFLKLKPNIRFEPKCDRAEFRKNAGVRDIRVMDMMVIKVRLLKNIIYEKNQLFISQGQQDLKEVVEHWKQNNHIMAKWFKEDYIEEKPKAFVGKFLAGHE